MIVRSCSLLVLGACRYAFDLTIEPSNDAAGSAADAGRQFEPNGGFSSPTGLFTTGGADPQLSADHLTLWYTEFGGASETVNVTARASATAPFAAPMIEPAFDSTNDETDSALTADGLVMMFVRNYSELWEARRSSTSVAWSSPTRPAGFGSVGVRSLDLSPDGNVVYFESGDDVLQRTSRFDRTAAFQTPVVVAAPAVGWITVSADELLLFANRPNGLGILWAARSTTALPFVEQGSLVVDPCPDTSDADIAPGGDVLVARCNGIVILRR